MPVGRLRAGVPGAVHDSDHGGNRFRRIRDRGCGNGHWILGWYRVGGKITGWNITAASGGKERAALSGRAIGEARKGDAGVLGVVGNDGCDRCVSSGIEIGRYRIILKVKSHHDCRRLCFRIAAGDEAGDQRPGHYGFGNQ